MFHLYRGIGVAEPRTSTSPRTVKGYYQGILSFTIHDVVALKHAKLVIPAFTKGKAQLDPIEVEKTRGIATVRIHVERVIGLLRRKYTILEGTLATDLLTCDPSGAPEVKVPMIDRIIRVCSGLINLCQPIVPFD